MNDVCPDAVGNTRLGQNYKLIGIDAKGRANVKCGVIQRWHGELESSARLDLARLNCEDLLPILYTTTEPTSNEPKRCVVVMDRLRAVTFRHGGHKKFT